MSIIHAGGCLCGDVRYRTLSEPLRITICHCRFCQRFTGSSYLVEPIFGKQDVVFEGATAKTYDHRSDSSGKRVTLKFCGRCGTTLCLDLERFPEILGLCGGTFDDPDWFDDSSANCRHIFIRSARKGVVLPAGVKLYEEHALQLDGTPMEPIVLAHAVQVAEARSRPLLKEQETKNASLIRSQTSSADDAELTLSGRSLGPRQRDVNQ